MDQIKIGRFVAETRRAKGLTQRQLADQLSISDKTISKWETGKGLPDISLMLPLCRLLTSPSTTCLPARGCLHPTISRKRRKI